MTLQEQILPILATLLRKRNELNKYESDLGDVEELLIEASIEINKLISSACQSQKSICNEAYLSNPKRGLFQAGSEAILNAPPPTELERCYTSKEVKEIAQFSLGYGIGVCGNNILVPDQVREQFKEILSKEYGIKI